MADGIEVNIEGLDALQQKLTALTREAQGKAARSALRKAANVIRDRARTNAARVDDPATRESIYLNVATRFNRKKYRQTGDPAFRVGVLGGARQYANSKANVRKGLAGKTYLTAGDKGAPGGDTWYWRFLEFGTERMAARPFMRPALQGADTEVINTFVNEFEKVVDRVIRRMSR
ncbi:TPA: HK97 gp10 family phage protein [Escherichia coli]|nr:HK97 gp10 family phage protein [Escherichia coli]